MKKEYFLYSITVLTVIFFLSACTLIFPPPSVPTNLKVIWNASNGVALSWDNGSSNEEGFKLERSTNGATFSQIKTLSSNITSYTDLTVSPNSTYTYRIKAYNFSGSSKWSNVVSVRTLPASPGNLKWKFLTGGKIYSSPAIDSNGVVYVGSEDGNLYAVNPNGTMKWKFPAVGTPSCPSIGARGTVYIRSGSDLYSINPDGTLKWKYSIGLAFSSPAIDSNGVIYVGGGDWYLYAINPDGTMKWKYKTGVVFSMPLLSSPSIGASNTVYMASVDGNLYAITPSGTLSWKYKMNGIKTLSSPVIGDGNDVYIGGPDGELYAVNNDGTLKWTYPTTYAQSIPAIGEKRIVYIGGTDGLYAGKDGALIWKFQTSDQIDSSPMISNDGTIYVGCDDGYLYAINSNSQGLAGSPWPAFHHDPFHTGRQR